MLSPDDMQQPYMSTCISFALKKQLVVYAVEFLFAFLSPKRKQVEFVGTLNLVAICLTEESASIFLRDLGRGQLRQPWSLIRSHIGQIWIIIFVVVMRAARGVRRRQVPFVSNWLWCSQWLTPLRRRGNHKLYPASFRNSRGFRQSWKQLRERSS